MSVYGRIFLAGIGSALLLAGAFGFQYLGGLPPCPMCIWQRWPHGVAIVVAILAITVLYQRRRILAGAGAVVMGVSAALGLFHAGVERLWWEGPQSCTGVDPASLTADQLLDHLMTAPLVRCDEIVWEFLGLTMAGWNSLVSLGLGALWVFSMSPRITAAE